MKHIVVLTGAGISAESGIKTFRDADGLWEGHDIMEVASPKGFQENPQLVLDFYNQRRKQLHQVKPNEAHINLAKLQDQHKVSIITQNVDDLHERAGSKQVLHLHGELLKARSTKNETDIIPYDLDINWGDTCKNGHQLRPHIVWFGEAVPMIDKAISICETADILCVIGTSLQVYPAASLLEYAPKNTPIVYIDPQPKATHHKHLTIISKLATIGVKEFIDSL